MSKSEVKKVSRIKSKKKTWYRILAPKSLGEKELGETYISAPESAIGRMVKINLKEISGNVRDQNAYVNFRITASEGSALRTTAIGYELTPASIQRMVRKNTNRIDDYFAFVTKVGERVVLKSLIITLHKVNRSVQVMLRKQAADFFRKEVRKGDFSTFLTEVVSFKVQSTLKKHLAKIYPLKEVAIRVLQLQEKELVTHSNEESLVPAEVEPQPAIVKESETTPEEEAGEDLAEEVIAE